MTAKLAFIQATIKIDMTDARDAADTIGLFIRKVTELKQTRLIRLDALDAGYTFRFDLVPKQGPQRGMATSAE